MVRISRPNELYLSKSQADKLADALSQHENITVDKEYISMMLESQALELSPDRFYYPLTTSNNIPFELKHDDSGISVLSLTGIIHTGWAYQASKGLVSHNREQYEEKEVSLLQKIKENLPFTHKEYSNYTIMKNFLDRYAGLFNENTFPYSLLGKITNVDETNSQYREITTQPVLIIPEIGPLDDIVRDWEKKMVHVDKEDK